MKKYVSLLLPLLIVACTPHSDLRKWMDEERLKAERQQVQPQTIEPPVYKEYDPPVFSGLHSFNPQRLTLARNEDQGPNAPDFKRTKEILEGFGLDKIRYVGSLKKGGQMHAYVDVDNHVYTVKVGNHMGSDFGVITAITADKIILDETIQNTEGEWVHRPAEVPLSIN